MSADAAPAERGSRWSADGVIRAALGIFTAVAALCLLPLGTERVFPFAAFASLARPCALLLGLVGGLQLLGPRRRAFGVVWIALALAVGVQVGRRAASAQAPLPWDPARVPAPLDPGTSIVTFNAGNHLAEATRLARWLVQSRPEIVALQEFPSSQAWALEHALPTDLLPHRIFRGDGTHGRGLLSAWPLLKTRLLGPSAGFQRSVLEAVVQRPQGQTTVLVAHFSPGISLVGESWDSYGDLEALAARVRRTKGPVLLVGDLNLTPSGRPWARLRAAGLEDAWHRVHPHHPGVTFPLEGRYHDLPVPAFMRIDYVWWRGGGLPAQVRRGPDLGSDHLPLIVRW